MSQICLLCHPCIPMVTVCWCHTVLIPLPYLLSSRCHTLGVDLESVSVLSLLSGCLEHNYVPANFPSTTTTFGMSGSEHLASLAVALHVVTTCCHTRCHTLCHTRCHTIVVIPVSTGSGGTSRLDRGHTCIYIYIYIYIYVCILSYLYKHNQ